MKCLRFEVLMAMTMKITVFWDVTLWSSVGTRAIRKVTSGELVTKEAIRNKKCIIYRLTL
jgi:hypothetical protein